MVTILIAFLISSLTTSPVTTLPIFDQVDVDTNDVVAIFNSSSNDHQTHQSIIGGMRVSHSSHFPFQVAIRLKSFPERPFCGGSIIGERWVVTAAHCLAIDNYRPELLEVIAGTTKWKSIGYGDRAVFNVEFYIVHPGFNLTEMTLPGHDIALIKTTTRLAWDAWNYYGYSSNPMVPKTSIIELGRPGDDTSGKRGVVSGFGSRIEKKRVPSPDLFSTEVEIFGSSWCRFLALGEYNDTMQLCAGAWKGWTAWMTGYRSSVCYGDSGGPLVVDVGETKTSKGKKVLVGITSFGYRCGVAGLPSVFTRVSFFRKWIEDVIMTNGMDSKY